MTSEPTVTAPVPTPVAWYKRPMVQKSIAAVLIGALVYMLLHYTSADAMIMYGVLQAATAGAAGFLAVVAFPLLAFTPIAVGIVAGALLMLLRFPKAFRTAITGASLAMVAEFVHLLPVSGVVIYVISSVAVLAVFAGVTYVMSKISRDIITVIIMLLSLGIGGYAIPKLNTWLESAAAAQQYESNVNQKVSDAESSMKFTPYYPSYIPSGMTATEPELHGYYFGDRNLTVHYKIDEIDVAQSAPLQGQDQLINFKDNCDIANVYFAMDMESALSESEISSSRDNLSKCHKVATTANGRDVYIKPSDGQWTWFYARIGETNVIFEFDSINSQKYTSDMDAEIVKIVNSMQPFPKDKLKKAEY